MKQEMLELQHKANTFLLTNTTYGKLDKQIDLLATKVGKAIAEVNHIQEMWRSVSERISQMELDATIASKNLSEEKRKILFRGLTDMFEEWKHLGEILPGFCDVFACYSAEQYKKEEKDLNDAIKAIAEVVNAP